MTQTLPEPEWVKLALSHIDEASERLQLASEILSPFTAAAVKPEALPAGVGDGRQLDIGEPPQDVLAIAGAIIDSICLSNWRRGRLSTAPRREIGCIASSACR